MVDTNSTGCYSNDVEFNATKKVGLKMPNVILLKEKIKESGMTVKAIAEKSGILRETLYNRLKGNGEFTASEIVSLTKVLNLSISERDKIFLNEKLN